ncbi:MAG: hypothetical protein ABWY00_06570 [Dongiaceae bacterium]
MRTLLRRISAESWQFDRLLWQVDEHGEGVAVYRLRRAARSYSLLCYAHDLPAEKRSDRVIAEAWDATFVLCDGDVDAADIARLRDHVPKQEAGRYGERELILSRANRSVRLFDHVVDRLAAGEQPDATEIARVGYLMRTTAVYGNGKFGLADRSRICGRGEFAGPFQAEMLTVWLIRLFTIDIVEHMARVKAPERAIRLAPPLRRALGVGNATGLGMAPFLVHHAALIDRWIAARETALARVRSLPAAELSRLSIFRDYVERSRAAVSHWQVNDTVQMERINVLAGDLDRLSRQAERMSCTESYPWDRLFGWGEAELGLEAQEMLASLLIEPYGDLVDDLTAEMAVDEDAEFAIDGAMPLAMLGRLIDENYGFALQIDFSDQTEQARFWYVSEEKLEPRLGERHTEAGGDLEQPLCIARDIAALHAVLARRSTSETVADLLTEAPQYRHTIRRIQIAAHHPYAEICDNLLSAAMRPIDLLRCKLSFFGAMRFDPKSDRWLRITMFQYAPFPDDIGLMAFDDWAPPPLSVWR